MPSPPHLTAPGDFRLTYREGTRIANDRIILHARPRGTGPARIGIAVRRQLGGAVRRNRMKRRLRDASTRAYSALPEGMDVVIVPRISAADASFQELVAALTELFGRTRAGARS
jgi:ribonuclease P protein component